MEWDMIFLGVGIGVVGTVLAAWLIRRLERFLHDILKDGEE